MAAEKGKRLLGEILSRSGLIGAGELAKALEVQKASGHRLGAVLVALGYLTESDVARALAEQLNLQFIPDHELHVEMSMARLIPPSVARKTEAIPLKEELGQLFVAMADPLDVFSLDEIRHLTRRSVQPMAATRQGVLKAIAQYERLAALRQREGVAVDPPGSGDPLMPPDPDDTPVVQLVNELADRAISDRASDIHVEPAESEFRVRFRVDGFLREIVHPAISFHAPVVARIKVLAGLDISERRMPQDGRIELRDRGRNVDIRVSTLPTVFGEKVVLRLFDKSRSLPRLQDLGFGPEILEGYTTCAGRPHGMLLVTGPTGSGKTSTLLSTVAYLNSPEKNIVTIEDPVEYQLAGVNHVQVHARVGMTFAEGLRAILRQDPNVIMLGEVRDGETADVAVRAALTGHLVLSTLHTNDAAGALTRLVDMGVEPYLIASSVLGVLAQRLLRRLCTSCRQPYEVDGDLFAQYGCPLPTSGRVTIYRANGCPNCNGAGYLGRFPIFEFLRVTPGVQEMVIGKAASVEIQQHAISEGMKLLITNGLQKVLEGLTTPEEIFRVASPGDY